MHKFLVHRRGDHVGVATTDIEAGERVVGVVLDDESRIEVETRAPVPLGHKLALEPLESGAPVVEYGVQIGVATDAVVRGDYVHTHNLRSARW